MRTPAFQFYPKDWLTSEAITLMTPAQEGAYCRLLCHAWLDPDCSIPDDDESLAQLSRMGEGWLKGGCALVRARFIPHPTKPHRLVNERLMQEREKQLVWREKSSLGGVNSAKRRSSTSSRVVQPPLQPNVNQRATFQSSSSCTVHTASVTAENIYAEYPKKVGRPNALKAIRNQMKNHCPGCLLEKVKAFAKARNGDTNFCPHPSTWFNQERFNDDPSTWAPSQPALPLPGKSLNPNIL